LRNVTGVEKERGDMRLQGVALLSVPVLVVMLTVCVGAHAQEQEFEQVGDLFQREYDYEVGNELALNVDLSGLRWSTLEIQPRNPDDLRPGRGEKVDLNMLFENTRDDNAEITIVVLLEGADGGLLERLECRPIRVGDNEVEEERDRQKVLADSLAATEKVYVFAEVEF
jgi:hypothetical protein